jgi:hypothetical protein
VAIGDAHAEGAVDRTILAPLGSIQVTGWTSDGAGVGYYTDVYQGAAVAVDTATGETVIRSK